MTKDQIAAAKSLHKALKKCAAASLGVYAFDGNIYVCPQPDGREHTAWDDAPLDAIVDLGMSLNVPDLDADGGAGR